MTRRDAILTCSSLAPKTPLADPPMDLALRLPDGTEWERFHEQGLLPAEYQAGEKPGSHGLLSRIG